MSTKVLKYVDVDEATEAPTEHPSSSSLQRVQSPTDHLNWQVITRGMVAMEFGGQRRHEGEGLIPAFVEQTVRERMEALMERICASGLPRPDRSLWCEVVQGLKRVGVEEYNRAHGVSPFRSQVEEAVQRRVAEAGDEIFRDICSETRQGG